MVAQPRPVLILLGSQLGLGVADLVEHVPADTFTAAAELDGLAALDRCALIEREIDLEQCAVTVERLDADVVGGNLGEVRRVGHRSASRRRVG